MIKETKLENDKSELATKQWHRDNGVFIPYASWIYVKISLDLDLQRGKTFEMNNVQQAQAFVDDPKNHNIQEETIGTDL